MLYRVLADVVVVLHLAFILYVAFGGFLAWRWPKALYPHLVAVVWAVGIVTVGYECPLTPLEKYLRRLAEGESYSGGFVDRYVEGVVYPESLTPLLRALMAVAVVVSYAGIVIRRRRRAHTPRELTGS